ncbi:asparaginase [Paenibacillus sp. LMG 31456]|uniref:Asparaginase n=1 Tax=Paenibacillus foliorum TaxID=2654974 RepID=A0A972GWS4_9BACL|nr:asparaginase [Paenibacillus foliorum]NOU95237.1 asparaginase [Paenibacillus foliorum]
MAQILVEALRGAKTESLHRGHIAVVNANHELIASVGDSAYHTFARSTAKPLQAIPLLEMNGDLHFQFDDKMIALLCASHNGEDSHAAMANQILHRIGLDEGALQCGVHDPFHLPTANRLKETRIPNTPLRNNCSGKHSGMLALSQLLEPSIGATSEPYVSSSHPIQLRMLDIIAQMCDVPAEQIDLGTDGCGVPVFAMPLESLAYAYARLGKPTGLPEQRAQACRRIVGAITQQPYYIAGSDRFDTRLIEVTQGRIIGKMGAEGMFALTIPEKGWGAAFKIEDGTMRAIYPAVMETLVQLDLLNQEEILLLEEFYHPKVLNCHNTVVGEIRPLLKLNRYTV